MPHPTHSGGGPKVHRPDRQRPRGSSPQPHCAPPQWPPQAPCCTSVRSPAHSTLSPPSPPPAVPPGPHLELVPARLQLLLVGKPLPPQLARLGRAGLALLPAAPLLVALRLLGRLVCRLARPLSFLLRLSPARGKAGGGEVRRRAGRQDGVGGGAHDRRLRRIHGWPGARTNTACRLLVERRARRLHTPASPTGRLAHVAAAGRRARSPRFFGVPLRFGRRALRALLSLGSRPDGRLRPRRARLARRRRSRRRHRRSGRSRRRRR